MVRLSVATHTGLDYFEELTVEELNQTALEVMEVFAQWQTKTTK